MISWFNRSRIRAYTKLSTRKQNKMKSEVDQRHSEQRSILDSRLANARDYARKADRLQKRGKDEKAKEEVNSFKLELASSQPVLNAYVNTALEKQLLESLSSLVQLSGKLEASGEASEVAELALEGPAALMQSHEQAVRRLLTSPRLCRCLSSPIPDLTCL